MKKKIVLFVLIMLFLLPALYSPENPSLSSAPLSIGLESQFALSADGDESPESLTVFSETLEEDVLHFPDAFLNDTVVLASAGTGSPVDGGTNYTATHIKDVDYFAASDSAPSNVDLNLTFPISSGQVVESVSVNLYLFSNIAGIAYGYDGSAWHNFGVFGTGFDWYNLTFSQANGITTNFELNLTIDNVPSSGEIFLDYAEVTFDIMTLADSDHYAESFYDVSDWTTSDTSITTDGDLATITENGAGSTGRAYASFSSADYFEYYYEFSISTMTATTTNLEFWDGSAYNTLHTFTTVGTYKGIISDSDATTMQRIGFLVGSNGGNIKPDYLRISPSDEFGWQHDGSTTVGFAPKNEYCVLFTDGDLLNFSADGSIAFWDIVFDSTATLAYIDPDYYPMVKYSFTASSSGVREWTTRWYYRGGHYYGAYIDDTLGVSYENLLAGAGGSNDRYKMRLWCDADEWFTLDYIKLYSIANFTVTQSGATTDDYLYVDSGTLYSHIDDGYIETNLDPALSVTDTYSIYNLTTSGTTPEFSQYVSSWSSYSDDTRGATTSGTVTDIKLKFDSTEIISEIKFIEDSTAPTVVRSSSTPNDPEDDETITLSAVITDTVEVYKVHFDAIVYPAGFSDIPYYATEQSDNFWYYEFSTLQNGYYCFKIQATDGANTNELTEYAYLTLNVREAAIIVEEITLIGAGEDFTMMTFSARINRDCTYTIYEESTTSAEADTYTGSVTSPSFNLAWEKLDVDDSNVNFTIKFVSGSLTYNYTSQYQVAQTTFYVEHYNHNGPDWSEYVTVTGRITKYASYTVYIDDVEATTGTITNLDFDIEFSKTLTSATREAWHDWAIKFTNGSQTCWANGTLYLWKNNPDQAEIGGGDLGRDERLTIQMWTTIGVIIGVMGVVSIGLVYFKFDEVNKLQLPNYPTQPPITREQRRREENERRKQMR